MPAHALLFTIDIDSLYTNINTAMGLRAVKTVFARHPDPNRPDAQILQLLEICLTHNDFLFDNQWYMQTQGNVKLSLNAPFNPHFTSDFWMT